MGWLYSGLRQFGRKQKYTSLPFDEEKEEMKST
jgi:hypothetical protein